MECKHGGCYKCGSKEDEFLTSLAVRTSPKSGLSCGSFGFALCKKCEQIETEKDNVR